MKKFILLLSIIALFCQSSFAQSGGLNFQGVARNATGAVLANQKVNLKFSILKTTETGAVEYIETKEVTTNAQGIFAVVVGEVNATSFAAVDWKASPKFLKVEMDPAGGTSFLAMGTTRLQNVPFAYYANGVNANNIDGTISIAKGGTGATDAAAARTNLGLGNVDNTPDAAKPISAATQAALDLKATAAALAAHMAITVDTNMLARKAALLETNYAPINSPSFTGTVLGISKNMVGLGSVDNTTDAAKPVSTATQTALDLKAPLVSPTFTGTVSGITKGMVGLGLVDNTTDAAKPISAATQAALDLKASTSDLNNALTLKANVTALNLKAPIASPTFTGNVEAAGYKIANGTAAQYLMADGTVSLGVGSATVNLANSVTGVLPVTNGGTGVATLASLKTNLALDNVNNTTDAAKPISTATQTALDSKAALASPTFTGTPLAPTPVAGTNTTQIATTAYVQNALLNSSSSSALTGAIWTSATTGTLNGVAFTITLTSAVPSIGSSSDWVTSLSPSNYSTSYYSSGTLSSTQSSVIVPSGSSWQVVFATPVSNLKLYVYWRSSGIGGSALYQFDQAFSILNGSNGLSKTNNTLNITGWGQGILEFTNPVTTLNLTADGAACCSGHSMTFAAGGGIPASGTGEVLRLTSATLVTPNLGTPSSVNLTNGTGLPLATGVTGVLTIAKGGTGSSTQNFVDLTSAQTVAGAKSFTGSILVGTSTGTTVSAALEVKSTTQGFLPPRMNATQRDAISSPVQGLVIYCTNCGTYGELEVYNGASWVNLVGSATQAVPAAPGNNTYSYSFAATLTNGSYVFSVYKFDGSSWAYVGASPVSDRTGAYIGELNNIHYSYIYNGTSYSTYAFNGTTWSLLSNTGTGPSSIYGGFMGVINNKIYHLGYNGTANVTYSFNGTTWQIESTTGSQPSSLYGGYLGSYNSVSYFAGYNGNATSLYSFNGTTWSLISSLSNSYTFLGQLGNTSYLSYYNGSSYLYSTFNGTTFSSWTPTGLPSGLSGYNFNYMGVLNNKLYTSISDNSTGARTLYSFDGTSFTNLSSITNPGNIYGGFNCYMCNQYFIGGNLK